MRLTDISEWSKFFHKKLDNILPESIHDSGYRHAMQDVDAWIAEHTIEAETVRYGVWVCGDYYDIGDVCSECDWDSLVSPCDYRYCPNCGAKMDKE